MRGNFKSPKVSKTSVSRLSPDGLGSGKSNVWSLKDREDIYSRRHNGEEWETICKDYPQRTRHAMQQQYSVTKKQHEADNPSTTSVRRGGRRRRGIHRGTKWATVNHPRPESSDDGIDSDLQLEMALMDDDDDEDEGVPPPGETDVPEEDEPMLEAEDHSPSNPSPAPVDNAPESPRRQSMLKERPLKRPYTSKEAKRSSISTRALFPNLNSRPADPIDLPPVDSDPKLPHHNLRPADHGAPKRRTDADGSDSESRSSSRLSKRRKYSTEPSEPFTILPADSAASLKLLEGFKTSGLFFHPDAIAKAKEDWRNMSSAYESEKASRKETFEAALKRATRRANDAEHKLQDASQDYADKLKVERQAKEASEKAFEAIKVELQAEKAKNEDSVSLGNMAAQLSEQEEHLKLYDALRAQINTQIKQLESLQVTGLEKSEVVKKQQSALTRLIDNFSNENFEDISIGRISETVKNYSKDMHDTNKAMAEKLEEARGMWRTTSEAVSAFHAQFGADTPGRLDTSN